MIEIPQPVKNLHRLTKMPPILRRLGRKIIAQSKDARGLWSHILSKGVQVLTPNSWSADFR